jgi:hypothetical protein
MADSLGWVVGGFAVLFFTHWTLKCVRQWQHEHNTGLTSTDEDAAN